MNTSSQKILVGLSGGVDSSVSAALLQEQGHAVTGAFIVPYAPEWLPCNWREERLDAMRVAAEIGIPFITVDLSKEYKKAVVDYMIQEYTLGRTPNPDIMCNKHVKFGAFFQYAMENGYDTVATGHYAQVAHTTAGSAELHMGVDANKDQTYFLWGMAREALEKTYFPIGTYKKSDVRERAEKFALHTATKKDSQGVCFLGKIDMKDFLAHYITETPGDVLDVAGNVIGRHDGAFFLTLGQRHGFTVHQTTPNTEPLYVVAKDVAQNTITVATRSRENERYTAATLTLQQVNWLGNPPEQGKEYSARFRYRQPLFSVTVAIVGGVTQVHCTEPQQYVSKGQSLVLYEGTRCMGGGIIEETE